MIRSFCFSSKKNVLKNLSWSLTVASTLLALTPSFCAGAQVLSRINGPIDESAQVVLKGNVHKLATAASDEGPVDGNLSGRMLLLLRRSPQQEIALRQLVQEQLTVDSPNFHKWLTPQQFGEQFGVADTDIETVSTYLSAHGFTVGRVYKNKMAIEVTGTAAQLSETFHTEVHSYSIHGQRYFANANDPSIPAALAPVVQGFASLNNIRENNQDEKSIQSGKATFEPETHRLKPAYTGQSGTSYYYYVTPADIQTIYNIPVTSGSVGAAGAGVLVGVIGDSQINVSLVERYQSLSGATGPAPVEIVDGNDPGILTTGTDAAIAYEQLELISAAAPAASLYYYTSATTDYDTGLDFAMIRAVEDNAVSVLAFGFQTCEATLTTDLNSFINQEWLQAAAQGITVVAATGDSGSAACDAPGASTTTQGLAVNGYASTPYDTAVGGTDFYYGSNASTTYWNTTNTATYGSAKSYIPEQPWDDSYTSTDSNAGTSIVYAGGGGFSTVGSVTYNYNETVATSSFYPVASWQTKFLPNGTTARAIPDVAFFAGNNFNSAEYAVCVLPTDCETGGTTLTGVTLTGGTAGAAAIFAGIMAEIVESTGSPQGNVNPTLYYLATQYPSTSSTPVFHSPAAGTNSVACSTGTGCSGGYLKVGGKYAYPAASGYSQGYNLATGLGSVNATNLINKWKNPATTATTTALAITNPTTNASVVGTSVVHGTALNFTATVTGTGGPPTGDVGFSDGSLLPGEAGLVAVPLVSGVAASTYNYFLPGGSYNVTAHYAGDSTFKPSSTTQPITVTAEPSRILIYSTSPATGTSVPFGTLVKVTSEPFSLNNNNVSVPTGTMSVFNNGANYPFLLMPISSEGTATFSSTLLPASTTYNLYFSFSGDPSYQPSSSQTALYKVTVTQASTTTALAASGTSASSSTPITLTATIQPVGALAIATGVPPTGSVTFSTSTTAVPLVAGFNSAGQAIATATTTLTSAQLAAAGTAVTATYSGDGNYTTSNGSATYSSTTPTGTATTFTLTSNGATVAENGTLTLTGKASTAASAGACTVTYTVNNQYTNEFTGTMTIKNTGTAAVNNFALTWTYANGQVMQYFYTGAFTQTGANVSVGGTAADDNTTLAAGSTFTSQFMASWNNATNTNPTAFALNGVPCNNSTSVPGTVQLYANGVLLTGDTFSINNSGTGTYTIPLVGGYLPFASGNVVITGVFTPTSSSYKPSSATTTESVTDDLTTADFSISTDTINETITPSSSNVYFNVQLTSLQNFAGSSTPIALSCSVPANSNLRCTLGTNSTTINTSGIALTTLEVSGYPTVNNGALKPAPETQNRWWLFGGGTTLAFVFLFGIPARRKGWQGIITVLVCAVLISTSVIGCGSTAVSSIVSQTTLPRGPGGSAGANYAGGIATNDVAPGIYAVVITGTATTNTTLVHNTEVTVTVTTTPSLANGSYNMTNLSSQLLMTDPNGSTAAGTQIEQYSAIPANPTWQKWIYTYSTANPGYYTIQNASNNLYVTDPGSADSTNPYTITTLTAATTDGVGGGVDATQLWTFNQLSGGYQIVSAASGGVLDDDAFGATNGTPVLCYPPKDITDGDNQTWYIN